MIFELIDYLTTSFSPTAKKLKHRLEFIAILSRARRLKSEWKPHYLNCHRFIIEHAKKSNKKETVLVFGAGHLGDLPISFLAKNFKKVILTDIAFGLKTRITSWYYGNIELYMHDVTENLDAFFDYHQSLGPKSRFELKNPKRFLNDNHISFVISSNLLSQIPLVFSNYFNQEKCDELFCAQLINSHLNYLNSFKVPHVLITDRYWDQYSIDGELINREDALCGVNSLDAILDKESWDWKIAPRKEVDLQFEYSHHVYAIYCSKL